MKIIKSIFIYLIVVVCAIILSDYFSIFTIKILRYFGIQESGGGWIDLSALVAMFVALGFFISLLITVFGGEKKYWVLGVLIVPKLLLEFADNGWKFFIVSTLFAVVGWLTGYIILKLYKSFIRKEETGRI